MRIFKGIRLNRYFVIGLVIFYSLCAAAYLNIQINIRDEKKLLEVVAAEYETLKQENDQLRGFLADSGNPQKIEQFARIYRGYSFYDENIYYDITPGH